LTPVAWPAPPPKFEACASTTRQRLVGTPSVESELEPLGILAKHSTPYHPETCGKVERFHQTLKRFLARQPPPRSLPELQLQPDSFRAFYNHHRPHRALDGRTPLVAFNARLKAHPIGATPEAHFRVRHDHVDQTGTVTLRYLSRLHHIGVGRAHRGESVHLLVANKDVRILADDGSLIRQLTLDPSRDYQPRGVRPSRPRVHDVLRQVSRISFGFQWWMQHLVRVAMIADRGRCHEKTTTVLRSRTG